MKHDIFEFTGEMTAAERWWRIVFLASIIATLVMDIFIWRP